MAAARAVGVSQPTLGRHISDLEQRLGVVLFERTGRGLLPTAQAIKLVDAARMMESGATAVWRAATVTDNAISGAVRVSASQPIACVLLPPILAHMRKALPDVTVELVVSNKLSNLLRREADIALRMVRPDQASLVMRRVASVEIAACAHKDYLRRMGRPRQPEDLYAHELIAGDRDNDVERGFAAMGYGTESVRFCLRTDDLMAQWAAVRSAMGVGFIAKYVIPTDPQVAIVLPDLKLPKYPIWLTVHREIRTSARIRAVYDFLSELIPEALSSS